MSKPYLIGLTGGSGSGKTTFIRELETKFRSDELCIISQDDYYFPKEKQRMDAKGVHNFDLPSSIDSKAFAEDLIRLISGETVQRKEYTFNNENAHPKLLVFRPAPIILVEGIFVFHYREIMKLLDLKIFLDAKENLKVIRRIKRDRIERNYPIEDVLYRYEKHVMPTFEKYILPYKDEADIIINNNENFNNALEVVQGFIYLKAKKLK
ncbi:MAG: uridine kinase [Bacteroidota bacterium]